MMGATGVLAQAAVQAATRDRWFAIIAGAFSLLILATSAIGLSGGEIVGFSTFDRTAASLISLTLLFVPLLGLMLGAGWLAAKRESGALGIVLAQPVTRVEVFAGEFLGVTAALIASIAVGFGLAATILGLRVGPDRIVPYLTLTGLAAMLALSVLGIGFLISAVATRHAQALGLGIFIWLVLVIVSDFAMLGIAVTARLGIEGLLWLLMANPVDVYRIAAILSVVHSPEFTGPVGLYMVSRLGAGGAVSLLCALLACWAVLPFSAGLFLFCRRSEP
jgi:Cu-processing system permease protein